MVSTTQALERAARSTPGATALVGDCNTTSYSELLEQVRACAESMRSYRANTIALLADNSTDWVVADLAAQFAGVAVVPVPGFFSLGQIHHAIRDSGAEAVLLDHSLIRISTTLPLTRLGQLTDRLTWFLPNIDSVPAAQHSATAKVSYTSGTTGEPKGVCLAQTAMDCVADSLVEATQELNLQRHLCVLPLALLLENVAGIYAPLRNGGEICLPSLKTLGWGGGAQLDAAQLLECIASFQPDSMIFVPQILHSVLDLLEKGAIVPNSLKFVAVGGGYVSPTLLQRAEALGLPLYEGYGLTEAASVVAMSSPKQRRAGTVGRPLAHSNVRIGANGEVLVSGATYCGYVGNPQPATDEIATGDVGHIDEDGLLYISGRLKSIYITSFGRNVSPEWIEAELVKQPSIAQVAVFGEARPWSTAVVVPAPGALTEDIDADVAAVNAALPDYARVGDWIAAQEIFTPVNGLLTGNGRNRRIAIWDAYRTKINARYDDVSLRA